MSSFFANILAHKNYKAKTKAEKSCAKALVQKTHA